MSEEQKTTTALQTEERHGDVVAGLKAEMVEDEKVLAYWVEQAASQKRRADEAERRLAEEWANMDATMKGWDALCLKSGEAEERVEALEVLLRNLVAAEEHLIAIRSQATWIQMGHDQGGIDAINKLSRARIEASVALRTKPEAQAVAKAEGRS